MKEKPAVFLDRDGVLIKEKGYIACKEDIEIFSYTAECIKQIKQKGYYAIVITNQSGIARGYFTEANLCEINQYLVYNTGVDAVYYCPHHPCGKIEKYKYVCHCRKPDIGLFERACKDFNIDMSKSYMVGDRASDILAGQNVGVKTILLESGYGSLKLEGSVIPDYILEDLQEVLEILE